jgi:iron complex transport system substrate-binding protein
LGDRVVGVTSFCNYPPEVKEKPRIGTYWEFNLEAILALKPDLVMAMAHQGEGENSLGTLRHWKIPYYLGRADTLPELFRLIEDIARFTGREEVARRKLPQLRPGPAGWRPGLKISPAPGCCWKSTRNR